MKNGGTPPQSKTQAGDIDSHYATFWSAALLCRFGKRREYPFEAATPTSERPAALSGILAFCDTRPGGIPNRLVLRDLWSSSSSRLGTFRFWLSVPAVDQSCRGFRKFPSTTANPPDVRPAASPKFRRAVHNRFCSRESCAPARKDSRVVRASASDGTLMVRSFGTSATWL